MEQHAHTHALRTTGRSFRKQHPIRLLGIALVLGGLIWFSVMPIEGHIATVQSRDPQGNALVDAHGDPVVEPNPAYVAYQRRDRIRTFFAGGMMAAGGLLLAGHWLIGKTRAP